MTLVFIHVLREDSQINGSWQSLMLALVHLCSSPSYQGFASLECLANTSRFVVLTLGTTICNFQM